MPPITTNIAMSWALSCLCIPCATACTDMIVIVNAWARLRLVSRTGLRLQFRRRPPAVHWYQRWSSHRNSVITAERDPAVK